MKKNNLENGRKTYNKNRSYIVRSNCIGTKTLHNSFEEAIISKQFIDDTGCSGICKHDHEIINIDFKGIGSRRRKAGTPCSAGLPLNYFLSKETHDKEMQYDSRS